MGKQTRDWDGRWGERERERKMFWFIIWLITSSSTVYVVCPEIVDTNYPVRNKNWDSNIESINASWVRAEHIVYFIVDVSVFWSAYNCCFFLLFSLSDSAHHVLFKTHSHDHDCQFIAQRYIGHFSLTHAHTFCFFHFFFLETSWLLTHSHTTTKSCSSFKYI